MAMVMAIAMEVTGIPRRRIDSRDGRIGPGLRMSIMGILMGMMMGIMNESLDIIVIIIIESMVCFVTLSQPCMWKYFTNLLLRVQNLDTLPVPVVPLHPAAPVAAITDPTLNPPPQPAAEAVPATAVAAKAKTKWPRPSARPSPPVRSRRSASVRNRVNGPGRRGSGFSLLP